MRSISAVLLFLVASVVGTCVVAAEAESVIDTLKACAKTADPDARFKCYDRLGQQVLSSETAVVAPAVSGASTSAAAKVVASEAPVKATQAPAVSTAVAEAPAAVEAPNLDPSETIGGYQFEPKRSAEEEVEKQVEEGLRTRVVKCQKSREAIWYFKLENGQIWKQVDRQSLSFQGCDFGAVVANDGIGYVLRIDGRKGKIRIKRRQ